VRQQPLQSTSSRFIVLLLRGTLDLGFSSIDSLQLPPISELAILKVIERLRPSMSVGHDGPSRFIIKGYSTIFAPLHKYIFDVSLSREHLSRRKHTTFRTRRKFEINYVPEVFKFVIYHTALKRNGIQVNLTS
jgi:hypothetical protein